MKKRNPTSEQLRDDIDRGKTGDKVPAADPAAAPLGADDEAAGMPPTPAERQAARSQERASGAAAARRPKPAGAVKMVLAICVILIAAAALFLALQHA